MKIQAIKKTSSPKLDLDQFSKELRALSDRHGVKLISIGAMATVEASTTGTMYLAIWSVEADENQKN